MAEEVSVYADENIQVTNLRAMLQGKTYAMANLTSVSMFTEEKSGAPGVLVAVLGLLLALIALSAQEGAGCFVFVGASLLVVGLVYARSQKNVYWVRIGSASGETNALSSTDRGYIHQVVNAMNEAIIRRG